MVKSRYDTATLDLLSWEAPEVAIRFEAEEIRAATLQAQICKAVSVALADCGKSRDQVAQEMSAYLGVEVTENMLNAYTSPARENHNISAVRLIALAVVTGDHRLLSIGPDRAGLAVVEERYLSVIRAKQMRDKAAELADLAATEERRARGAR